MPNIPANTKPINLAVQGGGAHGAFAWGAIDSILEDGRLSIEGISGASAGSLTAVLLAYGLHVGGPDAARQILRDFWFDVSRYGELYSFLTQTPWERFWAGYRNMDQSLGYLTFDSLTRWFSPYQLNPFDVNPLKEILLAHVNFKELRKCTVVKLFLSATNVRTGQVRVFSTCEITPDAVLASACLPTIFKAVEIDGEYYWDGGYSGNPSLFPFFYRTKSKDILIIHINPMERPPPPMMPVEIFNRINEISFNSALLKEFRAIAFVQKLLDANMIKDEYKKDFKYIYMHSILADSSLNDLSISTKYSHDWDFLLLLHNRGLTKTREWLTQNFQKIGVESSFDLRSYLVGMKEEVDA